VGERKKLKARRVYSETNTSMLLSEPIKRSTTILTDNFNPFEFAEYSDVPLFWCRKRMTKYVQQLTGQLLSLATVETNSKSCSIPRTIKSRC